MNIKKYLPNFLTCCNLFCGCLGIVYCLEERSVPVAYFVWAAALFDFLDGFAARMLNVHSAIGKELDSLADVVSFGVLPSLVMYKLIATASPIAWLPYSAFLIAVFSALRLAIFNIDETQRDSFKGLNTPANTLFITSLPLLSGSIVGWLNHEWVLVSITLVFSLLLVSPLKFFAFKFKNFRWADNQPRFIFIGISALLLIIFQVAAVPLIILLYIVASFITNGLTLEKH